MYDGLDGSCSIFHFEIRVALTSRVLISFISFLDEKFRTPLILKVGGTAWTKNALGGIAEVINVATSRLLMLADFHWRAAMLLAIFQSCFVSQMEPLRDQLGFELSYLRGLVLVIGVLRTLVIWKRSNVQNWSPPVVAQLIGRSGEDWSPPVAQGLSFCIFGSPQQQSVASFGSSWKWLL